MCCVTAMHNSTELPSLTLLVGERSQLSFRRQYDAVHIDEAWFYLRNDGVAVKCLKNEDGSYSTFEVARTRHKRHVAKVMCLVAVARPNPRYDSNNGKLFLGSFTDVGTYSRGPRAGMEKIINVPCDSKAYCEKVKAVVESIKEKMWYYHNDANTPEAGKTIYVQQDGASPHTSAYTKSQLARYSSERYFQVHGFRLQFVTQPAQPPDVNVCDLTFWHSMKSHMKGRLWATKREARCVTF